MRLQAALVGDLPAYLNAEKARGAAAASGAIVRTAERLKGELRAQVMSAFGSERLAKTWRSETYPRPPKTSLGAAGMVYSRAPDIIEAFSQATTIRSKNGFWLAIPSPDCPRLVNRQRVTPSNFPEARFGKLRFVYRRGKASLLVVDGVRRTSSGKISRRLANGGRTKSGRYRQGVVSVVMFFLVPLVRLKKRLDPQSVFDKAPGMIAAELIAEWNRADQA